MENVPNVYFNPVFIEPTFKHSLLSVYKHRLIVLFEVFVVFILIYLFFRSELNMFFMPKRKIPDPIDRLRRANLACEDDKLMIYGLPWITTQTSALSINSKPIVYKDCAKLLRSINGSQPVSLNDVLRR
ncbi:Membrane protein CL5 [Monkeypox virus]|nr:Membrane protein CL5 [Monkeypox virus]